MPGEKEAKQLARSLGFCNSPASLRFCCRVPVLAGSGIDARRPKAIAGDQSAHRELQTDAAFVMSTLARCRRRSGILRHCLLLAACPESTKDPKTRRQMHMLLID